MIRRFGWLANIVLCLPAFAADPPQTDTKKLVAETSVPAGYRVEIAAAAPLVEHPLMADFDDRGRLYIAESSGQNLDAQELLDAMPNFVRRLEDVDGDGRFDRSTIFADKMTMPMGALWHQGALYVASPPYIWKLEDTNDDGVADRREQIVGKFGFVGNAADIHGCFLGPNGRLYWCDGRHGHRFVDAAGQVRSEGRAARIFSCRLDGSDIEVHCGGGMDNPVEIDFTATGEMLGTVNLMYQKRGDCLVNWAHGGVYPRDDQQPYIAEFKRTGDLLGPVVDFGHVAVSGMTRYRNGWSSEPHPQTHFVTQFNTHKLVRVELTPAGSTFAAKVEEFWASSNPDCHPTDVIEDADGSLLVIDTGGWFRNGCPTSQVAKPEIRGAIYRIRATDASAVGDPRGLKIDWAKAKQKDLVARFADPRPAIREKALQELARRGDVSVPALTDTLRTSTDPGVRQSAVWTLTRIDTEDSRRQIRSALDDAHVDVRQTAAAAVSSLRDVEALTRLNELVVSDEPAVRRSAATALGRLGRRQAVPTLLESARRDNDRLLDHAIIYALIEINDPESTLAGIVDANPQVRRTALIALDQMDSGGLTRDLVGGLLDTDDLALQRSAIEIVAIRGWSDEFVRYCQQWLTSAEPDAQRAPIVRGALLAFVDDASLQQLVADTLATPDLQPTARALLLDTISRSELVKLPASWVTALDKMLNNSHNETRRDTLAAVDRYPESFVGTLERLAHDSTVDDEVRTGAVIGLARSGAPLADADWQVLASHLDSAIAPLERLRVADAIGAARLTPAQVEELCRLIEGLGPLELPAVVHALERLPDPALGERVLAALAKSPGLASLSPGAFHNFPESMRQSAESLVRSQTPNHEAIQTQLASYEAELTAGSADRGRAIFFGAKAACFACHTITGQGGQIGPDLSKIGAIRNRRDLLEAVAFPSQSLARGFESYAIETTDGRSLLGVIRRETAEHIWLRTADRSEVRLARPDVEQMIPSPQSIMPDGLVKLLLPEERADLLAYLNSLR